MIHFSFVSIKDIIVHNLEPMPLPAIYGCNKFVKHYSTMNPLSKSNPNTSALEKLHKMVKLDEIIHQTAYLITLGSLSQKGNYFLSATVSYSKRTVGIT